MTDEEYNMAAAQARAAMEILAAKTNPSVVSNQIHAATNSGMGVVTYTGTGTNTSPGIGVSPNIVWTKERNTMLSLSITVCANGYVVGAGRDQFVCMDMKEVGDRVIGLLGAHQMDMQK